MNTTNEMIIIQALSNLNARQCPACCALCTNEKCRSCNLSDARKKTHTGICTGCQHLAIPTSLYWGKWCRFCAEKLFKATELNKYTTPPKEAKTPQTPKLKPVYRPLSIPTFSPLPKCAFESEKKAEIVSDIQVRFNVFGEKEFFNPTEEKVVSPNVSTQVVLTPPKAPSEKHNYNLASPISYAQKQLSLSPCSVAVEPSCNEDESYLLEFTTPPKPNYKLSSPISYAQKSPSPKEPSLTDEEHSPKEHSPQTPSPKEPSPKEVRTVEDDCERLLLKISSPKKDKPTLINQARLSLGFQPRTKCKTCQTTWNCKPTLECQTCKRGFHSCFVQSTTHQRCQGCLHVLRKTTPTGSHMCGFCSNVYDSFYREGVCNENVPLATEMKKSHWYVEGVDRMRPDIYEYYRSPVKKGISLEHESEDEFRVARKPQRQTMILVD